MFTIFFTKKAQYTILLVKTATENIQNENKIYLTYIMRDDKGSTQARIAGNAILNAHENVTKTKTLIQSINLASY